MPHPEYPDTFGSEPIFDDLPTDSLITSQEARRFYDGTIFNGTKLARVEFTPEGKVESVSIFDAITFEESTNFVPGKSGGWSGEGGYYNDLTSLARRLSNIVSQTVSEWQLWKETEPEHPGIDFRTWKRQRLEAMENELVVRGSSAVKQKYHDFYVRLYNNRHGQLSKEEMAHYDRAMEWELEGLVVPLEPPKE